VAFNSLSVRSTPAEDQARAVDGALPGRGTAMRTYDAVVVGGSFAGLAVASGLKGNILLIDRKEIGSQTASACGTLLSVLEEMDCMDSVVHVYRTGYIHTLSRTVEFDLPYPFCAFDYDRLCQILVRRLDATIIKANVRGMQDGAVLTDEGAFSGTCVIDASGWRAVLASSLEADFVDRSKMSFGIETTAHYRDEGLHFWINPPPIRRAAGWLFPRGEEAGIGIGSYIGETKLGSNLESFVRGFGVDSERVCGGYFTWRMRSPTVGGIFLVGDAAGQCLPLTGEGIRPGMYFGTKCAEIVQSVIDGEISLEEGLKQYDEVVRAFGRYYRFLEGLQKGLLRLPTSWLTRLLVFLSKETRSGFLLHRYERRMSFSSLAIKSRMREGAVHR